MKYLAASFAMFALLASGLFSEKEPAAVPDQPRAEVVICPCTGEDQCLCGDDCPCHAAIAAEQAAVASGPSPKIAIDPVTGKKAEGPTVIMVTSDGCIGCQIFKNEGRPGKLVSAGWDFKEHRWTKPLPVVRILPTFRIYARGKWSQHDGPMEWEDLKAAIGEPVSYSSPAADGDDVSPSTGAPLTGAPPQ